MLADSAGRQSQPVGDAIVTVAEGQSTGALVAAVDTGQPRSYGVDRSDDSDVHSIAGAPFWYSSIRFTPAIVPEPGPKGRDSPSVGKTG